MKKILLVSLVVHAALLAVLAPWLKTRMEFDTAREALRTEEVRKRELARQEYERLERERRVLDPDTARKLKRETERAKRVKLAHQLDELRKLREEIMERQRRELAKLHERNRADIIATAHLTFQQQAEELKVHATALTTRAMLHCLVAGAYQNGHGRGAKGFIDELRIHRAALAPPFDAAPPAHRFSFDGDLKDAVTGRAGTLELGGALGDRPGSGGRAFLGNGDNARAEFWPIHFGEAFTVVAEVRLEPKSQLPQLLFANSHSGDYNQGFRVFVEAADEGATSSHVVLATSGTRQSGLVTRSLPGTFTFGRWHQVAVAIDKPAGRGRIFIDGRDVTAPDARLAAELFSAGSTIDGSVQEKADAIAGDLTREAPTPETAGELKARLDDLKTDLDRRMEQTPDLHDVRNEISETSAAASGIQQSLDALGGLTELARMNDTSSSVADKMHPLPAGDEASPAALYQEARELEQQIGEAYADANAATDAATGNRSYADTRHDTRATPPPRPDLAGELSPATGTPDTIGGVGAFRRVLERATNEVSDMTSRARGLLGTADNRSLVRSRNFRGSTFAANASRMHAARSQYQYGAVIDLASGSGDGNSGGMRADLSGEGADMASSDQPPATINLDERAIMAKALPGRRFTETSLRRGWLYLDTWYLIGPWENHSRVNFDLRHPPEAEIDFDARYLDGKFAERPGHPDRILSWRFYQSDSLRCQPPSVYAASTYYAYTEVWFENERDMLIAVASDDAASVWLNDRIIWQDRGQSSWQLGEGYRRVHFRSGYNKLLVRIENGPIHCVWSVLLCPPEILK